MSNNGTALNGVLAQLAALYLGGGLIAALVRGALTPVLLTGTAVLILGRVFAALGSPSGVI